MSLVENTFGKSHKKLIIDTIKWKDLERKVLCDNKFSDAEHLT